MSYWSSKLRSLQQTLFLTVCLTRRVNPLKQIRRSRLQLTTNNTGIGGSRTLYITIDLKPPVIAQGESVKASVDEDDVSTFTIPTITATDPLMKSLPGVFMPQPPR